MGRSSLRTRLIDDLDLVRSWRIAIAYPDSLQRLSTAKTTTIKLPFLTATSQGPLHFTLDVTTARLHQLRATTFAPKRG
ncbi:MAG: hypothetical protein RJA70_4940 [Pseudomonadota bacterium]